MTEQKAQDPIDDLFRKTFENLPDTPANSGWDSPSERVWQRVESNIRASKKGWGIQSVALFAAFAVSLAVGLFWLFSDAAEKAADPVPATTPTEQPVATPNASDMPAASESASPTAQPQQPSSPNKPGKTQPRNSAEEQAKPANNAAQPLPGSKPTLPPNSIEAQKSKTGG